MVGTKLFQKLEDHVTTLLPSGIPEERKLFLNSLLEYIRQKRAASEAVRLNFICTHNSRRSQLAQVWAQTAAAYFGVEVSCFSGGTEATAFAGPAVKTLEKAGFRIESSGKENPVYRIYFSETAAAIVSFSKQFEDQANPKEDFAAVMTCDEADQNCPFIPGAEKRISLPYKDPKEFDGSAQETAGYDKCSRTIATEMWYVFSNLN